MKKAKYVIVKLRGRDPQIIVFPISIPHDEFRHLNPIRAGFITINSEDKFECFGKSVGLRLESDIENDSLLANDYLFKQDPFDTY